MNELNNLIHQIEQKLSRLTSQMDVLMAENAQLKNQLDLEKRAKESLNVSLSEIEKKYHTLKVTNSLLGSEEYKRETKLKINSLIREIDHCISQLSQ